MKTRFLQLSAILFGTALTFSSCKKQEIEDLQNDVATLQTQLDQTQQNAAAAGVFTGDDEVIFFSMSGNRGIDSVAFTLDEAYRMLPEDKFDYSYYEDNGDGTYYIYVERAYNADWEDYAYFEFNIDPSDNSITDFYSYNYGTFNTGSELLQVSTDGYYNYTGETDVTTINSVSFDANTGAFSIDFSTTDTEADNYNSTGNASTWDVSFMGNLEIAYGEYLWKTAK